jgi:anti-repressor protein
MAADNRKPNFDSQHFVDLLNQIINFEGLEIGYVVDENGDVWLSGSNSAELLGYNRPNNAIAKRVPIEDKTTFDQLKKYLKEKPYNAQDTAIYISESGFYTLVFSSKMPAARKIGRWVFKDVLPSIRKNGYYKIDKENGRELDIMNARLQVEQDKAEKAIEERRKQEIIDDLQKKLDEANGKLALSEKERQILLENQKCKKKYPKIELVYVAQPADLMGTDYYKVGRTDDLTMRLKTYNTGLPNAMTIYYYIETDYGSLVENCIKSILADRIYRDRKEYYVVPLSKLVKVVKSCALMLKDLHECHVETQAQILENKKRALAEYKKEMKTLKEQAISINQNQSRISAADMYHRTRSLSRIKKLKRLTKSLSAELNGDYYWDV